MVIYTTVKEFGALIFATIMTTRQLLNILLSCIIYLHPLTIMQWVGVAMVFGTMYVKSSDKKESGKGHAHGGGSAPKPLTDVKVEKVRVSVEATHLLNRRPPNRRLMRHEQTSSTKQICTPRTHVHSLRVCYALAIVLVVVIVVR